VRSSDAADALVFTELVSLRHTVLRVLPKPEVERLTSLDGELGVSLGSKIASFDTKLDLVTRSSHDVQAQIDKAAEALISL
jgi:hypothetical protein